MILSLYLLTPAAACLFWVLIHIVIASRTDTFRLFSVLFVSCGLFIYSEVCHEILDPDNPMYTAATLTGLLVGPCMVPLLITYIRRLMHAPRSHPVTVIWIIIPAALFTAGALLSTLQGDDADRLFLLVSTRIYNWVLAAELAALVIFILILLRQSRLFAGTLTRFLRGERISLARLQLSIAIIPVLFLAVRTILGINIFDLAPWIQISAATLLLLSAVFFGMTALFGTGPKICMQDYSRLTRFNYGKITKDAVVEDMLNELLDEAEEEALKRIHEKIGENLHLDEWHSDADQEVSTQLAANIFTAVSDSWDEGSLMSRFQRLMMEEHLFLHPRLTLDDVADKLDSNKTYVSKLVNNTYNLGFPELINTLRIDYAEQYILSHREAKQDEIARACGFLSASSFNTTFKKVTGITPKVWIASMDRQKVKDND